MRNRQQLYPDFTAELEYIDAHGMTDELLNKIIKKHRRNAMYNRKLYERYQCLQEGVDIASRKPRFADDAEAINNKLNNDFFSECIDFVVGYFAGVPIAYGYSVTEESKAVTGGDAAVDKATKAITDFITRNNMHNVDMETVRYALICGYAGRLFYVDPAGDERVLALPGNEVIILSNTSVMEPQYAIRYYTYTDINGVKRCKAYFYDSERRYEYDGTYGALKATGSIEPHLFDCCPLMGVPINEDMLGYCEKVLSLIDDYDKCMSDVSNDLESFSNAHMVFENVGTSQEVLKEAQHSAVISFPPSGTHPGSVHYLTKEMNIAANNSHLDRLEKNIYRFTHTPNLDDRNMGDSSGQALKHRLLGLETKCGIIQAKMESAIMYMWRVLSSAWAKKKIAVDPLQCTCAFKRNFPLDITAAVDDFVKLKNAGYPLKECVEITLPWVEDADYIVSLMEEAMYGIPSLDTETEGDDDDDTANGA